ncbi:Unknown protein [Striga hermonthica]|uniref:Uncharacterized protein n=1 Tax=Striga hermonthica TaxID=68872 RepID=A0A9N7NQA6_STRHE|nr:Unknown protein [Striga hermonthica]
MVPTIEGDIGSPSKQLSAMQLAKGAKRGEPTYVVVLKEDNSEENSPKVPDIIRGVLEENKDVMPAELPRKLPPRRGVDRMIELEPGTKPPAMAPYRLERDPVTKALIGLAKEGKTQRVWVEDGLLYTKGRRLTPKPTRTVALLETNYFWPQLKDDVETYVRTCLVCQKHKIENRHPAGLLEPLPTPAGPWDSITLDFISSLPQSEGYGSIMVVVDRFTKYGTFIPCSKDCTAEEAAREIFKNVVKHWGLPRSIIRNRDPRFTWRLWTELFKLLGTELNFSTSFHPQTDGQTERVNALLECYLRHFISAKQRDWAKLLDVAQFSYNSQRSESTGQSPFEVVTGRQPLTPHTISLPTKEGRSPGAEKMVKTWEEHADLAWSYLHRARRRMKKWADKKRRPGEFSQGELVFVKLLPQNFKTFRSLPKGLIRKYEGPYPVIKKIGNVAYRVDLPPSLKIHLVFHASMLKPYKGDMEDPSRGLSSRAPPITTKSFDKEVEAVLTSDIVRRRGVPPKTRYLIKWKGLPDSETSWDFEEVLWKFKDTIERYTTGTPPQQVGENVTPRTT